MNVCSTIRVAESARSIDVAGAADGALWFQVARQRLDTAEPGLHAIDFDTVRLATVSWLREGPLALRKYAEVMRPDIFLIVTNLAEFVREELAVALEATGSVIVTADLSSQLRVRDPLLMGHLDPALRETLRAVEGQTEFDATSVSRLLPRVGPSAASNRLAALETKRILKSERRGRTRVYRPVLEDLHYGYRDDREGNRQLRTKTTEMPRPA
jgi:DNA-binding transcriptional ArsR family regulator